VAETRPHDLSDGDDVITAWTLIADQMAPWRARVLTEPLVVDADAMVRDDVLLMVSELVTNAVEHGCRPGEPILLNVSIARRLLRVDVTDRTVAPPVLRRVSADRIDGRGLWIVEQLADRWGVDVTDIGKSVWFEMRLGPTAGPSG
jgi:two-component sensor histidine kinase